MNAVTGESISHLFVFHLVDHLCISMIGAHKCEQNWATSSYFKWCPFHNPKRNDEFYTAISEGYFVASHCQSRPLRSSFPEPSLQTEGIWALIKMHWAFDTQGVTPSRGWASTTNQTHDYRKMTREKSRLANHGAWNLCWDPPISFTECSLRVPLQTGVDFLEVPWEWDEWHESERPNRHLSNPQCLSIGGMNAPHCPTYRRLFGLGHLGTPLFFCATMKRCVQVVWERRTLDGYLNSIRTLNATFSWAFALRAKQSEIKQRTLYLVVCWSNCI